MEPQEDKQVSPTLTPYYKQYYEKNKEKYKLSNKKYRDAKKAKIQNEKVENEKKGVVIEETSVELKELKKQLTDIQLLICKLVSNQLVKDAEDDYQPVVKEPINRYIKSLQVPSSSYTSNQSHIESESEIESNTEESEFEIDADGNII